MLTYNMDVTPESIWKRTTPSEAELAQPYYCTEAGVFYAQQHFPLPAPIKKATFCFIPSGVQGSSSRGKAMWCSAPGRRCC